MLKKTYDKKIREEQEATAHVFQDFINTFQVTSVASPKAFVRSGVLYADKNELKPAENQIYKPKPFIKNTVSLQNALECAKILKDASPVKRKNKDKPKSNLEELKDELKLRHSEKSERERLKEEIINSAPAVSYFEGGDSKSTNLFVASLDPGISETYLTEQFGAFGPLASVKIMWPRECDFVLPNAQIKVTIPLNRKVLNLVHRMVEYVAREGPLFEAMIMNNEIGNPDYNFLFENKSPVHVYYRWKLFSILQGESTKEWRMEPFRMFKGGSIWLPPIAPDFYSGMPEELIKEKYIHQVLSESQCERFIEIIHNLTLNRASIAEGMIFCINHTSAIDDAIDIIIESLSSDSTKLPSKIARFYLLFDVMSNCAKQNVKINSMLDKLKMILEKLYECFTSIKKECDKVLFGSKVIKVLQQFGTICLVPTDLFENYESLFKDKCEELDETNSSGDEPLDGASLLKRSLKSTNKECIIPLPSEEKLEKKIQPEYFIPSKWDSVDPEELETQSMSSTQIFYMQQEICNKEHVSKSESDVKGEEKEVRKRSSKKRDDSPKERKSGHKKRKSGRDYSPRRYSSRDEEKRRNKSRSRR